MGWSTKNPGKEKPNTTEKAGSRKKAEAAAHRNRRNHHPSSRRKTIPSSHPQHLNNITLVPVPFTTSIWNKFTTSSHLNPLVPSKSTPIRMRIEDIWGVRIPQRVEKKTKKNRSLENFAKKVQKMLHSILHHIFRLTSFYPKKYGSYMSKLLLMFNCIF